MLAVLIGLVLVLMLAGAGIAGWWLRRSELTPAWASSNDPAHFPAQLLLFCAFVFLPYIACPVLLVWILRERRRQAAQRTQTSTD
jgi:heme/copper-type cytochrome/quinol oxidase subunit 2